MSPTDLSIFEGSPPDWQGLAERLVLSIPHDHSQATGGSSWSRGADGKTVVTTLPGNKGNCDRCRLDQIIERMKREQTLLPHFDFAAEPGSPNSPHPSADDQPTLDDLHVPDVGIPHLSSDG